MLRVYIGLGGLAAVGMGELAPHLLIFAAAACAAIRAIAVSLR